MPAEKIQPESAHRVEGRKGSARSAAGRRTVSAEDKTQVRAGGSAGRHRRDQCSFYEKGVMSVSPGSPPTE